jgi:hypothetical protein
MGDKQPALLLVVCILACVFRLGGRRAAGEFLLGMSVLLAVVATPFLLQDPIVFLRGITAFAGFHDDLYGWNVWVLADQLHWPSPDLSWGTAVNVVAMGVATVGAVIVLVRSESARLSAALLAGVLLLLVAFLSVPWSAYSYYASVAPLLLLVPIVVAWEHSHRLAPTEAASSPTSSPGSARTPG